MISSYFDVVGLRFLQAAVLGDPSDMGTLKWFCVSLEEYAGEVLRSHSRKAKVTFIERTTMGPPICTPPPPPPKIVMPNKP